MLYRIRHIFAIAIILAVLAVMPLAVNAQVSVTPLNPSLVHLSGSTGTISLGYVSPNPAAIQWGSPWRIGVGKSRAFDKSEGVSEIYSESEYGGGRAVGKWFAVAGEFLQFSSEDEANAEIDDAEMQSAAVSGLITDYMSIGAGWYTQTNSDGTIDTELNSRSAGVSLRFGKILFLGAVVGEDEVTIVDSSIAAPYTNGFDAKRDFRMYGAGLRVGGSFRFHSEYYVVERDSFVYQGTEFSDLDGDVGIVEMGWADLILGYRVSGIDEEVSGYRKLTESRALDLVWGVDEGLSVGFHMEDTEQEIKDILYTKTTHIEAINIVYLF